MLYGFSDRDVALVLKSLAYERRGHGFAQLNGTVSVPDVSPSLDRRVRFRNDSGETCPLGGLCRVTGVDDIVTLDEQSIHKIEKPNTIFQRRYLVNTGGDVPGTGDETEKLGWGSWLHHNPGLVLRDTTGTPAFGQSWGAKNGEWKVFQHRPGFFCSGILHTDPNDNTKKYLEATQEVVQQVLGMPVAEIAHEAMGDIHVYVGTQGSETDGGQDVEDAFAETILLPTTMRCGISWPQGLPYATPTRCPPSE